MLHEKYMRLALELAAAQKGQTSPNPLVGAVIVKDHQIIGMGAHLRAGEAHAEVHALRMAGEKAKDATMYVTLEPCSHHGRTPPCAEAVIQSGVKTVYVATLDPNPLVAGRGIKLLQEAGIEVQVGLCEQEVQRLNEGFNYYIVHKRPYVTLKMATSLDGKIATVTGESQWITGEESRADVHLLRHQHDAILVGVQTVIKDDPRLTTRLGREDGKHPIRIVLDSTLRIPINSQILDTRKAPTWIFTTEAADHDKVNTLEQWGVKVFQVNGHPRVAIDHVLEVLGEQEVSSLLLEGGGEINASFLENRHVHKVVQYIAPKLIGGDQAPTPFRGTGIERLQDVIQLVDVQIQSVGSDIKITGKVKDNQM